MNNITNIIDTLRSEAGESIEAQGLSLLTHVMAHDPDPLIVKELMDLTDSSQASVIRNLRVLGVKDEHPRGDVCRGLLNSITCSKDRRRKVVTLSAKGRRLKSKIENLLES